VAPHIAVAAAEEFATQTADAVTVTVIAGIRSATEAAAKVIAARTGSSAIIAVAGKCAGGYPARASMGCPHGSFWSTSGIYEAAVVIACPILLLFAHHCGISAEPSARLRLNYYLIENLEAARDL
jgi:hypothetical protein